MNTARRGTLGDALGKGRPHLRHRPENLLNFRAQFLDTVQARALNLDAHRGLDSRELHVETILDRHGPRVGQPRELELGIHFRNQLLVGHPRTPLPAGFEHHRSVVHIEGSIVSRTVGPADGAEHCGCYAA